MSETDSRPAEGTVPAVTNGERVLAVLALGFAVLVALIGVDMLTGGKISGLVTRDQEPAAAQGGG